MMQVTIKKQQRGPSLKLSFYIVIVGRSQQDRTFCTDPIDVDDMALVRFSFCSDSKNNIKTKVAMKRSDTTKCSSVKLSISNDENFDEEMICSNDWSEDVTIQSKVFDLTLGKVNPFLADVYSVILDVNITVQDASHTSLIANRMLYEDKQFTDFQLRTPDGSVAVHKVVLATHSEVFKSLLSDESRDMFGHFTIQGVTVQTLRHLKDYMYLGTLPATELPQLLLVAVHSKMSQLRDACTTKLAAMISADDLDVLIDFAIRNNIPELLRAILSVTPDSIIHGAHQIRKNKLPLCTLQLGQLALEQGRFNQEDQQSSQSGA